MSAADLEQVSSLETATCGVSAEKQSAIRLAWDDEMGHASTPVRHDKTAVLMLYWDEKNTDDHGVAAETERLAKVFREKYGFEVTPQALRTGRSSPQAQAMRYLAEFVEENDHERNLLLVYYAGHGWTEALDTGRISLSGTFPSTPAEKEEQSIEWTDVERALARTRADVFVIFDCCHAGLLCRPTHRGISRCYEYLAACGDRQRTRTAGPKSFTTAMTWALEQLATKPGFHSSELISLISKAPNFPEDQYPVLYPARFAPSAEYIYLAPSRHAESLSPSPVAQYRDEQEDRVTATAVLDLRCFFKPPLTEEVVRVTARELRNLMRAHQIPCQRIELLDHNPYLAAWALKRWKQSARKRVDSKVVSVAPTPILKPNGERYDRFLLPPLDTTMQMSHEDSSTGISPCVGSSSSPVPDTTNQLQPVRNLVSSPVEERPFTSSVLDAHTANTALKRTSRSLPIFSLKQPVVLVPEAPSSVHSQIHEESLTHHFKALGRKLISTSHIWLESGYDLTWFEDTLK